MEKIRLSKYFTDCGVMSRRAAEEEIKAGKITVNGHVAELGEKIDPEQDEVIDAQLNALLSDDTNEPESLEAILNLSFISEDAEETSVEEVVTNIPAVVDETDPGNCEDEVTYDEISDELSQMLAQVDELATHDVPAPVVAPEPVEIVVPEIEVPEVSEPEIEDQVPETPEAPEDTPAY